MKTVCQSMIACLAMIPWLGCAHTRDLAHDPFPEAQVELRQTLEGIMNDAKTADVARNRVSHLESDKFTKFGGRQFERQNYEQCIAEEAANITSKQIEVYDPRDLKIDVFGDVAILTYYPFVSAIQDDKQIQYLSRQTLVFLKTADGWKVVHEHKSQTKPVN